MNFISAYIIRQVATDGRSETIDDIIGALKRARQMLDPLAYVRTRFVKIGSIGVELGKWHDETGTAKDYPDGTSDNETITNGIARMYKDSRGLGFCLYKTVGYDTPVGEGNFWGWYSQAGELNFNWIHEVLGTGQLWRETRSQGTNAIYKVLFLWNVPLFSTGSEANAYAGLVSDYWTSGLDTDLDAIGDYLEGHMTDE